MSKNKKVKKHNNSFLKEGEPTFDPYQFHLYFSRRVDDLIKLELTSLFQKMFWEQPY